MFPVTVTFKFSNLILMNLLKLTYFMVCYTSQKNYSASKTFHNIKNFEITCFFHNVLFLGVFLGGCKQWPGEWRTAVLNPIERQAGSRSLRKFVCFAQQLSQLYNLSLLKIAMQPHHLWDYLLCELPSL